MAITKEEARQELAKLVDKYQSLTPSAIRKYTEADTRRIFIMPLFHALGWDVYSRDEVAEEVKAGTGRVDYVFKLHGVSQFYLEAKALRAELTKPEYVKQAITYAYNRGIIWVILTDFERLQVYNAQTGRLFINLSHDTYLREFDDLWLLSRESLENNALNERAEKYGALPPRLGVEQRLFNQLRHWREGLFTQLYHYNPNLSFNQIDEVIQRLFNRLIFIRTCEDRRIEDRVLLGAVHEWRGSGRREELIGALHSIFRDFDGYYDSDLFALHLVDQVFIESATIENIINGLYEIPGGMASYDFSLIDADVLGTVYEQYLGHVATVVKQRTKEAQIRMDLGLPSEPTFELTAKKERRKEHGIYYTPRFITDYIVKETVGRFLKERSHNEILNIKILDPACGSGSFLIRAYDELLNYHAYRSGKPVTELDQWERLPILIRNIFGVDLDMQAVEIACLNLLLRSLAKRETLPSLAGNIRQGNSLISGTEEELGSYFGDDWQEKKPFNWEQKFQDIMAEGGFDVVIGNPPYVSFGLRDLERMDKSLGLYSRDKFPNSAEYKLSTYALFIDRGLQLLKEGGYLSYILPDSFLLGRYFSRLRKYILDNCSIKEIVLFKEDFWSSGTIGRPVIIILRKTADASVRRENYITANLCSSPEELKSSKFSKTFSYSQSYFDSTLYNRFRLFFDAESMNIVDKVDSHSAKLTTIVTLASGLIGKEGKNQIISPKKLSRDWLPGLLSGSEINRYALYYKGGYILYDTAKLKSGFKDANYFESKILMRQTGDSIIATYDTDNLLCLNNLHVGNLINNNYDLRYILGCLNSKLMNYYYHLISLELGRAMAQTDIETIEQLPIRRIDFDNPSEKKIHDDLVAQVDKMLELNKRLAPIRNTPCNERDELLREINRTDSEIDNLVYDLYGLIEEERKIIEGS